MREAGKCVICGRRVKNKIRDPDTDREYFICPRHLEGKSREEIASFIKNLKISERFFLGC